MTKIYQETFGKGKPIVLVHGWAMHSGIWREFARCVAQHYRVTCIDLPGHGHSEKIDPFTLERIGDELVNVIPEQNCCWLGWSLGATVVLDIAARYPERVSALILLAGNPSFSKSSFRQGLPESSHRDVKLRGDISATKRLPSLALDSGIPAGMTATSTEQWPGMDIRLLDDFAEHLNKNCQATLLRFLSLQVNNVPGHKALLKQLKTAVLECATPDENTLQGGLDILKKTDLRPVLSGLTIPVSVILGGLDTLVPVAAGRKMQQLLPSLELNVIDRAGHVPFLSHSRETLAIISRFMDQRCS